MTTVTKEIKTEKKIYIVGQSPLLCCLSEGHAGEAVRETLRVHLAARALQVVPLPVVHVAGGLAGPHGEQVCHEGGEPRGQARLSDEAELELRQADDVVSVAEGPAGDVHQVGLAGGGE